MMIIERISTFLMTIEFSTWVLNAFTGVLALFTYMLYKSSNKQSEVLERQIKALNKLTESVIEIPKMTHKLRRFERYQAHLGKRQRVSLNQRRAVTGRDTSQNDS